MIVEFFFDTAYYSTEYYTLYFCCMETMRYKAGDGELHDVDDIESVMLDEYEPADSRVDCYKQYKSFHVTFDLPIDHFDISKAEFYRYGRNTFVDHVNVEILRYDGTDYQYEDSWSDKEK